MSMLERVWKERTRYILFFTSTSVILITLGIIQTLLFEAIAFFSEVANTRGWFSFAVNLSGVASAAGLGALMLVGCAALEWRMRVDPKVLTRIPEKAMLPPKSARYVIVVAALLAWVLIDSFVLRLVLLVVLFMWRRAANVFVLLPNSSANKSDRTVLYALVGGAVTVLFFSATRDYGGAFGEFFFTTQWTPTGACADRRALCENMSFGVNSLLLTTIQVAFGALFLAVPLGVGCAIYLSEYASPRLVSVVKPTLELLAGIPSVVYGFFAFIYIGPLVVQFGEYAFAQGWIDAPPNVLNPINGAIVVGVMILPLVASMSEDALRAVPNELREGSLALGATRIETTFRVMIQASLSGILASIILALSRAVGETMAVTLAVGTVAVYTSNMFLPAQTMTAYIAQRVGGDLPFGEIGYMTIFAVGLYLFVITLCLNLLGNKVLSAYREAY
ncbi:MAG: phosphate ABC transporter permease subunit PstC [Euryarchaeota archaeon]|nr:phosphate ABC transporter permease subunit PstC [Euryarchaeota archaeon]DAC36534.1 MAG TPA: phosphate ABC transporter permease subunit PstC [Candidatus Poseidoniales archaeon]HIH53303.1 phosphate ABC transporter permease subunit PstC [Candidatus Poseidoniaceae archaeon]|tara:strand:+ start:216 stop:1556 length:1341 start_codon:yes stop_codon:yes gene_type:complete